MHTLTVEWLIQSPSLWREPWNLVLLQQRMQCYELQTYSAHIMQLRAFWSASPHPASPCLAPGSSLVLGRACAWVTVGLGPMRRMWPGLCRACECWGALEAGVAGASPAAEFLGVTWARGGGASPSCLQAGITLQRGPPGMQLTQVMGLPFWALQEPALTSVLPGGCDPSPGWTPWLPGGISRVDGWFWKGTCTGNPFPPSCWWHPTTTSPAFL